MVCYLSDRATDHKGTKWKDRMTRIQTSSTDSATSDHTSALAIPAIQRYGMGQQGATQNRDIGSSYYYESSESI